MKLTLKMLREIGICHKDAVSFGILFGEGNEVTLERCILAEKHGFNFDWGASRLFSPAGLEAYREAMAPAWWEYETAKNAARGESNSADHYQKAKNEAKKALNLAKARAFYEASKKESSGEVT